MKVELENRHVKEKVEEAECYSHFPFVSGEMIEKHRKVIGAQLKNELQSYLNYQKTASSTFHKLSPAPMRPKELYNSINKSRENIN